LRYAWYTLFMISAIAIFLAGCEGQNQKESTNATPSTKVGEQTEIVVSAAASLQDALKAFAEHYRKLHPDIKLSFNYGASGALQRQIENGAPSDLFISAGQKQMDALIANKLIVPDTVVPLFANSLVVIVPAGSKLQITGVSNLDQLSLQKIAMGTIESVPAGSYTKEVLSYYGLWDRLQAKLVFAKDVKQVLTYVESGNVDAGFVYETDALTSDKVKLAFRTDAASHQAITYPAGVVQAGKHAKEATMLLKEMRSAEATALFIKFGFTKPGE
jgi:molybdate transport system substrate-binding protein